MSTFGSGVPGAARIYQLNLAGKVLREWTDVPPLVGVAAAPNGTVYACDITGNLTRLSPNGDVASGELTTPLGLDYSRGRLFAATGGLVGPGAGAAVLVRPSAFQ